MTETEYMANRKPAIAFTISASVLSDLDAHVERKRADEPNTSRSSEIERAIRQYLEQHLEQHQEGQQ